MIQITYGPGGFDPSAPDGNVVSRITVPDPDPDEIDLLMLAAMS